MHDSAGHELISRRLTDIGFGRRLIAPSAFGVSGLSLTPDGRHLYFVAYDTGSVFNESRLMHLDVEENTLEVVADDVRGSGGSISPDNRYYYFARANADSFSVYTYEIATHEVRQLSRAGVREYHMLPVVSPDGRQLAVTETGDFGVRIALYDARTGARVGELAAPEQHTFQASWIDDDRIIYVSSDDGSSAQVFETDLSTGRYRKLTHAPYLAGSPVSDGKKVRFLNRDGFSWTLDEVTYPSTTTWTERATPVAQASAERQEPVVVLSDLPITEEAERELYAQASPTADEPPPLAATAELPPAVEPPVTLQPAPALQLPPISGAFASHREIDEQPVHLLSEEDYSAFERFFLPQAYGPWVSRRSNTGAMFGIAAIGGDVLGLHRWAIGIGYDVQARLPSALLSYRNDMGAPYAVTLDGEYVGRDEPDTVGIEAPEGEDIRVKEYAAQLAVSRTWYGSNTLGLGSRLVGGSPRARNGRPQGARIAALSGAVAPAVSSQRRADSERGCAARHPARR